MTGVLLGIVDHKGLVDGRTLLHDLDRPARICGDVTDGEQAVRQLRTAGARLDPGHVLGREQVLSVRDRDEARRSGCPVDPVDDHRAVRSVLQTTSNSVRCSHIVHFWD